MRDVDLASAGEFKPGLTWKICDIHPAATASSIHADAVTFEVLEDVVTELLLSLARGERSGTIVLKH
jgi:hypothetical protein